MVNYKCIRCGYKTIQKSCMKSHLEKLIPCRVKLRDIDVSKYKTRILCEEPYENLYEKIEMLETEIKNLKIQIVDNEKNEKRLKELEKTIENLENKNSILETENVKHFTKTKKCYTGDVFPEILNFDSPIEEKLDIYKQIINNPINNFSNNDKINELEGMLLESYHMKPVVYIGYTENDKSLCKFGFTNNIKKRIASHKIQIYKDFKPMFIIETVYNREVEKDIKKNLSNIITSKKYNNKIQTEIINLNGICITQIYNMILKYKEAYYDKNIIISLTSEIEELKNKINEKSV